MLFTTQSSITKQKKKRLTAFVFNNMLAVLFYSNTMLHTISIDKHYINITILSA